jgi:hypothetical protein
VAASPSAAAAPVFVPAAYAASAPEAPLLARARFIDAQRASFDLFAVQLAHGVLRVSFRSHGHKRESAGFAREFILHQQDFANSASLRKHVLQLELRRRERQVAYVQSISHNGLDFRSRRVRVSRGKHGAEETPLTDPAEPEFFCAVIRSKTRTQKRNQSTRILQVGARIDKGDP